MSTIFQKTLVDNCLVLDPREALTYPFDLGNWSEIRVGVELSYVSATGGGYNIAPFIDEAQGGSTLTNSFLMGFRNTGTLFPDTVSGVHIGYVSNGAAVTEFATTSGADAGGGRIRLSSTPNLPMGVVFGGVSAITSNSNGNTRSVGVAGQAANAATLYADQQGFRVRLTGQGTSGQFLLIDVYNNNNGTFSPSTHVTPSVTGLRAFMSNMPNVTSGIYTPLTTNFGTGAPPLTFPNAFFLYSPFQSGSVRIHTLVVDRYA